MRNTTSEFIVETRNAINAYSGLAYKKMEETEDPHERIALALYLIAIEGMFGLACSLKHSLDIKHADELYHNPTMLLHTLEEQHHHQLFKINYFLSGVLEG